jgi:cytochrome c-type biogenesis protein
MEGTASFGLAVSFTAGLLSFLSPCVLPLVPSYVTFVTGLSLENVQKARRASLVHALLFVLGFTLIFLALGATATVLGRLLGAGREWITRLGGVLVIAFGLYLMGALNVRAFAQERRLHLADKPLGYLGTVVVGAAFGAGWTPCLGPILGSILTVTASSADLPRGLALLGAYSLGLAIPFVLSAVAVERFLALFTRIRPYLGIVSKLSGALLVVAGLLMGTGYFTVIARSLQALTPEALRGRI